jgi:hypothetical protein
MRAYIVLGGPSPGSNAGPQAIREAMRTYLVAPTKQSRTGSDASDLGSAGRGAKGLRLRILLSYFYFRDFDLDHLVDDIFDGAAEVDIFVDSGAYSAATGGGSINPNEYIEWVCKWQHRLTIASAPDVIGDPVATERDTKLMLAAGLTVPTLPVYHVGEPWPLLERMAKEHDYIALGGMVPYSKNGKFLRAWCTKAFKYIPRATRVHGFGMTNWTMMQAFPWYSVDSSSWTSGVRYGQFQLFERGRMIEVDMRNRTQLLRQGDLLRRYGLTARGTVSRGAGFDRDAIIRANLLSWSSAEDWMNDEQSKKQSARPSQIPQSKSP